MKVVELVSGVTADEPVADEPVADEAPADEAVGDEPAAALDAAPTDAWEVVAADCRTWGRAGRCWRAGTDSADE